MLIGTDEICATVDVYVNLDYLILLYFFTSNVSLPKNFCLGCVLDGNLLFVAKKKSSYALSRAV